MSKTSRYISARINFNLLFFILFNSFLIMLNKDRNPLLNHKTFLILSQNIFTFMEFTTFMHLRYEKQFV